MLVVLVVDGVVVAVVVDVLRGRDSFSGCLFSIIIFYYKSLNMLLFNPHVKPVRRVVRSRGLFPVLVPRRS